MSRFKMPVTTLCQEVGAIKVLEGAQQGGGDNISHLPVTAPANSFRHFRQTGKRIRCLENTGRARQVLEPDGGQDRFSLGLLELNNIPCMHFYIQFALCSNNF